MKTTQNGFSQFLRLFSRYNGHPLHRENEIHREICRMKFTKNVFLNTPSIFFIFTGTV